MIVGDDSSGIGMTSSRTRNRLINRIREEGIANQAVLEAMRSVPRHVFVDEAIAHRAYEDTALPIGHNQTISQPAVVARMTELLIGSRTHLKRVLEIGAGSGYQSAVLALLVDAVYAIERIESLKSSAEQRLRDLGYRNVVFSHRDGFKGWPEFAPFDGILVAAAPAEIPRALVEQLADGGRLVIPVGGSAVQELKVVEKQGDEISEKRMSAVRFVPLVGGLTR